MGWHIKELWAGEAVMGCSGLSSSSMNDLYLITHTYESWTIWTDSWSNELEHCENPTTCLHRSVVSESLQPHGLQPTRLLCPWASPGKNTGVGCHFLLQGIFLPKDRTWVSCIAGRFLTIWATSEAHIFCVKNRSLSEEKEGMMSIMLWTLKSTAPLSPLCV